MRVMVQMKDSSPDGERHQYMVETNSPERLVKQAMRDGYIRTSTDETEYALPLGNIAVIAWPREDHHA